MLLNDIKQKIFKYKYKKAKNLYVVVLWAKWGVLPVKYFGKIDQNGDPLTIHYTDCNGTHDLYYIAPWYTESTGFTIVYFFNEKQAFFLEDKLNKEENLL